MLFVCVNSLLAKLINCSSVRVCSITSSFSLYIAYILFLFLVFFTSQLCMCVVIKRIARLARAGFQSVYVTQGELPHKKLGRVVHVQHHGERVL